MPFSTKKLLAATTATATAPLAKPATKDEKKSPKNTSPLSPQTKKSAIEKLKKCNTALLKDALVAAALKTLTFPSPIKEKLEPLYQAIACHHDNASVVAPLQQAVTQYVHNSATAAFVTLLKQPFAESNWNSAFLRFICDQLKVTLRSEPTVQAGIRDGKIYWRLLQEDTVLYDRTEEEKQNRYEFKEETTWRMDWSLFQRFKGGGKRTSTVAITEELFAAQFPKNKQEKAKIAWAELKRLGVLTHRDRLAKEWQAISASNVSSLPIATIGYGAVSKALYNIANDIDQKECITGLPNLFIFRPDRNPKLWQGTGRVVNTAANSEENCTRRWDVSIYENLVAHKDKNESEKYGGALEFDHVPSAHAVKMRNNEVANMISDLEKQLEQLKNKLHAEKEKQRTRTTGKQTRQTVSFIIETPEIKKLNADIKALENKIQVLQNECQATTTNTMWTVAIPKELHHQGETFGQSEKDQKTAEKPHYIKEITRYLDILEQRGKEFAVSLEDYAEALGAFRYLYRCLLRKPNPIAGKYTISPVVHTLFQPPLRQAIDSLLLERIKRFMEKREGAAMVVNDEKAVPSKLSF